ncbi:penicillin-binding protein 1A [Inmirania thermothiophila]|uniref:Penicillin-binding protein 1A n=1 Tax=Inmirania thermothiophila TaxID=1750597 RepID=A0A3N1Y5N3_9GAMM|nr:penicillin-binding protein 1A [Inmirania thermothiophila]ROR34126.1 penicillin-binding protein 1A [Inmirania thermothiophila]
MRILARLLALAAATLLTGVLAAAGLYLYLAPRLPAVEQLRDVRLQVPLRIYTRDGALVAEYGEKRRTPLRYADIPEVVVQAFIAAEDDRFFEHPGVDYQGLLRAAWALLRTGEKRQGGSTITMQVARNFFLSSEKTFLRKLNEILLALKIERELTKEQILELYLNKIYLGNRAYGVAAAAQIYYGKRVDELTLDEVAMIAGLPKAPSRDNPVAAPERARVRRNYVLGRMRELGFIGEAAYRRALDAPVHARLHGVQPEVEAIHLAEAVREEVVARYGEETAYTAGLRVYTTLEAARQRAAVAALREALAAFERRHGYRGPEARIPWSPPPGREALDARLREAGRIGDLHPAVVTAVAERGATVYLGDGVEAALDWDALAWARPRTADGGLGPAPRSAADVLAPGDLVRVRERADGGLELAQVPEVEGALVALDPADGAVRALVGGFDFARSKFNRALQARRQPGSSFKPFIYSAALAAGYTAASIFNDAPVVVEDPALGAAWRPENYSGRIFGPTRLREALVHSRNLVSIRVLQAVGIDAAIRHAARFGFDPEQLPRNLSLALGSGAVSPLELARAYAVFANGGFRVEPYWIERIEGPEGEVLFETRPRRVCAACPPPAEGTSDPGGDEVAPRVLPEDNAYIITSMLRDVVRRGTGRAARVLGRTDLAGKTGTTNDQRDAWFAGFSPALVAVAWVGYDDMRPLGEGETGARAALPMWIAFMREALRGVPETVPAPPAGLVMARIDRRTGRLARAGDPDAVFEVFRPGHVPPPAETAAPAAAGGGGAAPAPPPPPEQLF